MNLTNMMLTLLMKQLLLQMKKDKYLDLGKAWIMKKLMKPQA